MVRGLRWAGPRLARANTEQACLLVGQQVEAGAGTAVQPMRNISLRAYAQRQVFANRGLSAGRKSAPAIEHGGRSALAPVDDAQRREREGDHYDVGIAEALFRAVAESCRRTHSLPRQIHRLGIPYIDRAMF